MANIAANAIVTRIREVIEQGLGTLRTISSGTYSDNIPVGLDEAEMQRRSMEAPRTRINFTSIERCVNSPPINGNVILYDATLEITVSRLLDREKALVPDDYDTVQAAGFADADVIRQALEYPGNLTTTSTGTATDIVSGMLRHESSGPFSVIGQINDGAQRLESAHRFTGVLIARPAT